MITQKEVKHIAKLARLGLTKREIKKFQNELSLILDYIEKLKEVDISKVKPTSHSILVENVMRNDLEKSKIKNQNSKRFLELAPQTKRGYLIVKSIFNHINESK